MEGGGAMEGRGSDVEYWRGETQLGSSLPVPTHRFPVHVSFPVSAHLFLCPRVVSCVRMSLPASPPCVVACVRTSLLVSACHCLHPFTFVGGRFHSWAWVVAIVGGRSSSFVGNLGAGVYGCTFG